MSAGRRRSLLAGALIAALVLVWLAAGHPGAGGGDSALPEAGSRFGESAQPAAGGAPAPSSSRPAAPGSPEGRAAGLMLAGFAGTTPDAAGVRRAAERGWGGVVLQDANGLGARRLRRLTGGLATAASAAGRPQPLVIAAPEVAAAVGRLPAQPDAADPARARAAATRAGARLRAAGIGLALDPSADIGWEGGAWADAAFSDDADVVAAAATATVAGWRAGGIASIPGHFPGEGGASGDPALGPATVGLTLSDLRRADLKPFEALAASAPAIQMSAALYAAWDSVTPASILPDAVRLLRATRFRGAIVSADLTAVAAATGGSIAEAAIDALKAGCDLLWIPGDAAAQDAAWHALAGAIREGAVPAARLREAEAHVAALRQAA